MRKITFIEQMLGGQASKLEIEEIYLSSLDYMQQYNGRKRSECVEMAIKNRYPDRPINKAYE